MGRKRKESNEGLPVGIYRSGDKYRAYVTETGKPHLYVGSFETIPEAVYKRSIAKYGHHWNQEIEGSPFGFIYAMRERKTGRMYIGKKQMYYWNSIPGGYRTTNPSSPDWEAELWRNGSWEEYCSSSVDIKALIAKGNPWDFEYKIIDFCNDILELHLSEVAHQTHYRVLEATMEDGSFKYFNKNIAGLLFRAQAPLDTIKKAKAKTKKAYKDYYLKPETREDGSVVPYEERSVATSHIVDNGRDFKDVR